MNDEERQLGERLRSMADRISVPTNALGRRPRRVRARRSEAETGVLQIVRERMAHQQTRAVAGVVLLAILVTTTLGIITPSRAVASSSILTVISGNVLVQPTPDAALRKGVDGETLKAGMTVQAVAPDGRAVLTFEDGSTNELEPGSSVSIDEVSTGTRGELLVRLGQTIGKTWSHVQPLLSPNSRFHIKTPSATAVVRGTSFEIDVEIVGANGQVVTKVNVFQGQVDMVAAGKVEPVTSQHTSEVVQGQPPAAPQQVSVPPVRLRLGMNSPAMLTVTDPDGRTAGQTPQGTVSQIPQTTVTGPQEHPQLVDVFSPLSGDWEIGVVPRGDGGAFQMVVNTFAGTDTKQSQMLAGQIQPGQRLVTHIHIGGDGSADRPGAFVATQETKAKIALAQIGATTSAPLPQAKVYAPSVDQLPPA
ncbi:MAG: FecR domain-containing protein, partial [Chloroflexota bacterium]|nr:FecR domain-containing protein [Chloroflexota bacterium]